MALQTYCSPLRYVNGGFGIADTGTTLSLRNVLVRATAMVDTFTNGSLLPEKNDFRGGVITGEQHLFQIPIPLLDEPGARRIFLNHRPIRTVSQVVIKYTNTYQIVIDSSQLFVSNQGFVEIVALNPAIIGFPPVGWLVGPFEPFSITSYEYGHRFAADSDVLEAVSPSLFMASHGSWLVGGGVTVTVDGVVVSPSDYVINTDDGTVSFDSAATPTPDQVVQASYTYVLPSAIESATAVIATDMLGKARLAQRGLLGLSSLKVAEVSMSVMSPAQMTTRNGVSIPNDAATLLGPFVQGSIG